MTSSKKEDYIEVRPADSVSNARKMPKNERKSRP